MMKMTELQSVGHIVQLLTARDLYIKCIHPPLDSVFDGDVQSDIKILELSDQEAQEMTKIDPALLQRGWIQTENVIVLTVIGKDATTKTHALWELLKEERLSADITSDGFYAPNLSELAHKLVICLEKQSPIQANWIEGSTLALIKPHAVRYHKEILDICIDLHTAGMAQSA